jgi:hypothetical protein
MGPGSEWLSQAAVCNLRTPVISQKTILTNSVILLYIDVSINAANIIPVLGFT